MTRELTVSIDAMGGDAGPGVVVAALARAAVRHPTVKFLLHGDEEQLKPLFAKRAKLLQRVEIRHTAERVRMEEKPSQALRRGRNTSMWRAIESVEKKEAELEAKATAEGKIPHVSWERIIDHIDHAVKLVGPDHVGLGSDFDGADMPEGMEDCTHLPQITEALMRKGYSDEDIRKILGGNLLRVMEANERVSREMQAEQ